MAVLVLSVTRGYDGKLGCGLSQSQRCALKCLSVPGKHVNGLSHQNAGFDVLWRMNPLHSLDPSI
eukprot:1196033-Prorocentrum_minimum.AAC.2